MIERHATVQNSYKGMKVLRQGRDWCFGNQGIRSAYGEIIDFEMPGWAVVQWFTKNGDKIDKASYRIGYDDNYDLLLYGDLSLDGKFKPLACK